MKQTWLILITCACLTASAAAGARTAGFTGTWSTNWGPLEMTQKGSRVMGHYTGQFKGIIDGTVSGRRLDFTWSQPNGEHGRGYFVMSDDGNSIDGMWGMDDSDSDGGTWTGTRVAAPAKTGK